MNWVMPCVRGAEQGGVDRRMKSLWSGHGHIKKRCLRSDSGLAVTVQERTAAISPQIIAVTTSQRPVFTATVSDPDDVAVKWSVDNVDGGDATVGTIDANGRYTPPLAGGTHSLRCSDCGYATCLPNSERNWDGRWNCYGPGSGRPGRGSRDLFAERHEWCRLAT